MVARLALGSCNYVAWTFLATNDSFLFGRFATAIHLAELASSGGLVLLIVMEVAGSMERIGLGFYNPKDRHMDIEDPGPYDRPLMKEWKTIRLG